jgi:hypothetical protein
VTQGAFDGSFDLASSDETPSSRSESVLRGWLPVVGPFTVGASFLLLCIWTWGRWFDPLVDFGRELYVPWRLREGQVLFRDIAWFNGPFSAYFNAALFRVFGTSITTLVVANLTILAAGTALLYLLVRSHASHLTATVTAVVALALFGFGHLSALGNFNFVAPYSHEATHGLVLGAAALAALGRWSAIRRSGWLGLAGALLGLCFLTKGEIFLAAAAGCGVLLAFAWRERDEPAAARARQAGLWLASVALPALASFVLLSFGMPASKALKGTLGSWPWIVGGSAMEITFYRRISGLLDPKRSALELVVWAAEWLLVLVPAMLLALAARRRKVLAMTAAAVAAPLIVALLLTRVGWLKWLGVARPVPVFVAAFAAWLLVAGGSVTGGARRRLIAWCVFALVLELKLILAVSLSGYGFVLALPGVVLLLVALLHHLPKWIDSRGGSGDVFRILALGVVAAAVLGNLVFAAGWMNRKSHTVGRGADRFLADRPGPIVQEAVDEIEAICPPGQTFTVLPEGIMLNYLARRESASRFVNFMPPELAFFGEATMVEDLESNRPDYVLVTHRPTLEYGLPRFGEDYGRELWSWIESHYEPIALYGDPPLRDDSKFGIELRRRRVGPEAARGR